MIFSQPLDQAWAALQSSPIRAKCGVAVVNGFGHESPHSAWPLIQSLCMRLSASGVVLLPAEVDAITLAQGVDRLAYELSHDLPLDVALQVAFDRNAVLIGNVSLLKVARVSQQVQVLKARLDQLSGRQRVEISERSVERLTRAKPPQFSLSKNNEGLGPPVFSLPVRDMAEAMAGAAPDFEFIGESHEATALTELSEAVRSASAQEVVKTHAARFVQQQSFVLKTSQAASTQVFDAYVAAEPVLLKIRIGDQADPQWQSSNVEFPFQELPPNESKHRLTVMFHEPRQLEQPLLADLELPRTGVSTEAEVFICAQSGGSI